MMAVSTEKLNAPAVADGFRSRMQLNAHLEEKPSKVMYAPVLHSLAITEEMVGWRPHTSAPSFLAHPPASRIYWKRRVSYDMGRLDQAHTFTLFFDPDMVHGPSCQSQLPASLPCLPELGGPARLM